MVLKLIITVRKTELFTKDVDAYEHHVRDGIFVYNVCQTVPSTLSGWYIRF